MRLNRGQVPQLSRQMVKALVDAEEIEVSNQREVERDLESVMTGYLDSIDQVVSRARDLVHQRGLAQGEFSRIKQMAAEQAGIKMGDDGLDYVLTQLLEMLMHSGSVEEVYAEDLALKRRLRTFLRAEDQSHDQLDREIRAQLRHVQEGTRVWEIEYERMKAQIKRRRGL
jgi:uncharacterized protein